MIAATKKLEQFLLPVATRNPAVDGPDVAFAYIDIASVDREDKAIIGAQRLLGRDAPSRARQSLAAGDVLVSTVRPGLNAVALVGLEFDGAVASTGFCVLRPDRERLLPRYLLHVVRHPQFVDYLISRATGATYPAVTDTTVKQARTYLPVPAEQSRIADILDRADAIRRKRREALGLLDELVRATFLEMFGDPVANPKGWPTKELGLLGELDRGRSRHRPRNDPALLGGPHPFIQTGDVANCDGVIRSFKQTYSELGLQQSRMWPQGTLCITIAANIAQTGVLAFDACFPDSIVGFTPGQLVHTPYVQNWLSFLQPAIEAAAPQSAQKNINLEILRALRVPVPPRDLQQRFTDFLASVEQIRRKASLATADAEALFSSLQERAFSGEL